MVFLIGIVLYFGMIAYTFSSGMCGNTIVETKISPNYSHKIILFERNCGTTTDFSTQISILKNEEDLEDESGNIFSADSDNGKAILTKKGTINIKIEWLSDKKILIEYDKSARVFEIEKSIDGIEIEYKKL